MAGRWFAERRLDYIDFRMVTVGIVNRADIMRTFGVSMPQASADLNRFLRLYRGTLVYDKSAKEYQACAKYKTRRGHTASIVKAIRDLYDAGHELGWK